MPVGVGVDKGFYHEARAKGKSPLAYLTELVAPEPPEVERVYGRCLKRFGQEPDSSYRDRAIRAYAYDICGLEKELAHTGIRVQGPGADMVEKFFSSSNASALFPVFLATQIIAGMLATSLVPELAATEVRINSHVAQKITISDTAADRTLKFVGEGADLPKTKISRTEGNVTLYKYGRLLEASYESVRLMHLDIFSLMLQRMGMQIGIDESDDCLETLIAGDGTASSAATITNTATNSALVYADLVKFVQAFPIGYNLQHAVVADSTVGTMLNMAEFKDPLAGFDFQRQGTALRSTNPLNPITGAQWHRWTSTGSASFGNARVVGVDAALAVILLREGDMLEESDQLIDKQIHQRTLSEWVGFEKLDVNATQVLNNN